MGKVRKASGCGIAPLRLLLALLTAALLAGAIACAGDSGVVAVSPSDEGLIAVTNVSGGMGISVPRSYALHYISQDGGLTWSKRDYPWGIPADWRQDVWSYQDYQQDSVDTPRGSYRIDGSDIQLRTPDGEYQTVYSAAHLKSPINRWLQGEKIDSQSPNIVLSSGPVSIDYDPPSGNVVAAMGILGAVVGTPDGNWTSAIVGPYYPVDFSSSSRVGALLSGISLWAAVLAFPLSMIALAITVVSAARILPIYASAGVYYNPASLSIITLPMAILFMLVAVTFAVILLVIVGTDTIGYPLQEHIAWYCLIISAVFSLVSVAVSLDSMGFSITGGWSFSRRMLAVTIGYFGAMMVFVLLPLVVWAQLGEYLTFAKSVSILICAASTVGLVRYYWRASRKGIAPKS